MTFFSDQCPYFARAGNCSKTEMSQFVESSEASTLIRQSATCHVIADDRFRSIHLSYFGCQRTRSAPPARKPMPSPFAPGNRKKYTVP